MCAIYGSVKAGPDRSIHHIVRIDPGHKYQHWDCPIDHLEPFLPADGKHPFFLISGPANFALAIFVCLAVLCKIAKLVKVSGHATIVAGLRHFSPPRGSAPALRRHPALLHPWRAGAESCPAFGHPALSAPVDHE